FLSYVFFFQAEDGIRDRYVTGVQTCALPISANPKVVAQWLGRRTPPSAHLTKWFYRELSPNRFPPHCRLPYLRRRPKAGRQTDPVRLAIAHIQHRSVVDSTQKHHRVVHHVSSEAKKPQSQNKSELFILSHPGTCTECLTSTANNPRYNHRQTQFALPFSGP